MRRNQLGFAVLATVGLLSLAGCYSMSPHPYGAAQFRQTPPMYQSGVPGYPQPVPRATYIMPGDPIRTVPGTVITGQQPTYQSGALPPATGNAPRATTPAATEKPVPLPREPEANGANSTVPGRQSSQLEYDEGTQPRIARSTGFSLEDVDPQGRFVRPIISEARSPSPARRATVTRPQPMSRASDDDISQVGFQNPSGHHPTFQWIEGELQYDSKRRTWHLEYDSNPGIEVSGGETQLSGNLGFTLADHRQFFRVYGDFHNGLLDRLGKPQYVVTRAVRVAPPSVNE